MVMPLNNYDILYIKCSIYIAQIPFLKRKNLMINYQ